MSDASKESQAAAVDKVVEAAKAYNEASAQATKDFIFNVKVQPALDSFSGRRIRVTYTGDPTEVIPVGKLYLVEALKPDGTWEKLSGIKHVTIEIDAKAPSTIVITQTD